MLFKHHKKSHCLLGLDLTNTTIKLLELSKIKQGYQVENYAMATLNQGSNSIETLLQHNSTSLTTILSEQINLSQFSTRNTAIALADNNIMNKVVRFDKSCTTTEIEQQIATDHMKYFAPTLEPVNYDYYPLGNSQQSSDSIDVWIIGIKQALVNNCVAAINRTRLQIQAIDLASLAIARSCQLIPSIAKLIEHQQLFAVLNITLQQASLIIYHHCVPLLTRTLLFESISVTTDLPNNNVSETVFATQRQNYITEQLTQIFDSFHASYQPNAIKQLLICGDISNLVALSEHLIAEFNISCSVANPLGNMSFADSCDSQLLLRQAHQWMICCGLAMRMRDS